MAIIHDFRPSVAATSTQSVSSTTGAPAPPTAPPGEARPADDVRLSQPVNPYQGISERTATVRADAWKKGPNGSVEQILAHQGYSREEMYHRDGEGRSLIQRVAEVNGMHDPNLLREGQSLLVPVRPEEAAPQRPANGNGTAPSRPNANGNGNGTAQVTVDRWGTGPNDSLERILVNQGYSLREIHRKDGDGRTMLDRVAADNDLPNANSLREGAHLTVPSRRQQGQDQQGQGGQDHHEPETPRPEPEAPHPQPEAPRPEPEAPRPQPETPPTPPADDNEATAEMGLLLNGARDQKFNRDEFQALNSAANRYEEMRSEYARDGFTNDELRDLGRFEQRYGDMYARFYEHDRSRISFAGGESNDPRVQERARLLEESGHLYDGFVNGTISYEDAAGQLMAQRARARQLGDDQR